VAFTAFLAWLSWRQHELEKKLAREGGESLAIAKQSADAASISALATQRLASQLRPWVALGGVVISNVAAPIEPGAQPTSANLQDPTKGPYIGYDFVNTGASPALGVRCWFGISFQEYPLKRKLPRFVNSGFGSRSDMFTGVPQSKGLQLPIPLTPDDIAGLHNATHAVYLYGYITYRDALGAEYITRFRLYHNRHSGVIGGCNSMTHYHRGNRAT
jgi:hypothetical protein